MEIRAVAQTLYHQSDLERESPPADVVILMENHRLVLPEHLNHFGFLFGGYLLKWVDEFAWMAATTEFPGCHFVTVGMNEVSFRKSVRDGSILKFDCIRKRIGNTSVTYSVAVTREPETIFSTEVTLVRLDDKGKKHSLPKT